MDSSTTFGASIVPSADQQRAAPLLGHTLVDSPAMTPAPSHESLAHEYSDRVPVQSPFYTHPPASHEGIPSATKKAHLHVYEKDLEAANDAPLTPSTTDEHPFSHHIGVEQNKECTMWPSKQTLKQKYQAEKQQRRQQKGIKALHPVRAKWSAMSKRSKLVAKILLALFIVGAAVGLGVGISKAVKGTYYVKDGASKGIER